VRPGTSAAVTIAVPPARSGGARQRTFLLHVPAGYSSSRRAQLVLALHGGNGTAAAIEGSSGLSALSDRDGFLVAYPQALKQNQGQGPYGWNASGPADPFANGIDDGLYVSDVLNAVQSAYCVDPARIDATGISNGGSMAGYLACVLAGRIAAFAPVEGVFFQIPGGCHPAHLASVLDVHVRTDPVAPYAGVPSRGSPDYYALAVPDWVQAWALRDRCPARTRATAGPAGAAVEQWPACPGGTSVQSYTFATGGHTWFQVIGAAGGDMLMLSFFALHPLRSAPATWTPGLSAPVPAVTTNGIQGAVREYRIPTPGAEPFDIAAGAGGSMWFTEYDADRIGRISAAGVITQYKVPTPGAGPYQIAAGAGGVMWFTEYNTTKLGRITPDGQVTEIELPKPTFGGTGIATGPAGTLIMADPGGVIDQVSATGTITQTKVPVAGGYPFAIALQGGRVWFTEISGYYEFSAALLTLPGGVQTLSTGNSLSDIVALTSAPSGALWFADFGTDRVGEVTPSGQLTQFPDGSAFGGLSDLAVASDGTVWFCLQNGLIGRLGTDGRLTQLALPSPAANPDGIAAGPGGTIWVTEAGADKIARITPRR